MPDGGIVGFDRLRLEQLRTATIDCWHRAATIRSSDSQAVDAMTTLATTSAFLTDSMLRLIDELLATDALARPIECGAAGDGTVELFAARPSAALTGPGRRWVEGIARRIDADPTLLDHLVNAAEQRHGNAALAFGAQLAVAGELGTVAALRLLANLSVGGVRGLPTVARVDEHASIVAALRARVDEALADPRVALEALEYPDVREWLVIGDDLDHATTALLLATGISGSIEFDSSLSDRSRAAWLGFVELARRLGARRFEDGVAEGLAIGAAAHLPTLLLAPGARVTDTAGRPVPYDDLGGDGDGDGFGEGGGDGVLRRDLSAEDLATLFGAVVVSAPAATVLFELIHDTAVHDLRTRLTGLDRRSFDAEADQAAVAHSLTRSAGMLDLVFDDAIDVQQARWNEIARAEAADRTRLITVLSTVASLVPGSGGAVSNAKTVFRGTLGVAASDTDGEADRIDRHDAVDGFDVQLARELVASIADSPTLREIARFDELTPATRRALEDFASARGEIDVTSLDGLLASLGIEGTDADVIAGQIDHLLEPVRDELEPHRD